MGRLRTPAGSPQRRPRAQAPARDLRCGWWASFADGATASAATGCVLYAATTGGSTPTAHSPPRSLRAASASTNCSTANDRRLRGRCARIGSTLAEPSASCLHEGRSGTVDGSATYPPAGGSRVSPPRAAAEAAVEQAPGARTVGPSAGRGSGTVSGSPRAAAHPVDVLPVASTRCLRVGRPILPIHDSVRELATGGRGGSHRSHRSPLGTARTAWGGTTTDRHVVDTRRHACHRSGSTSSWDRGSARSGRPGGRDGGTPLRGPAAVECPRRGAHAVSRPGWRRSLPGRRGRRPRATCTEPAGRLRVARRPRAASGTVAVDRGTPARSPTQSLTWLGGAGPHPPAAAQQSLRPTHHEERTCSA